MTQILSITTPKVQKLTKRQEQKLWNKKKAKKTIAPESSIKIYKKSESGNSFTRGNLDKIEKKPSKKLNII